MRPKEYPELKWRSVRVTAQEVLQVFLAADSQDIVESAIGLATVANEERVRQRKIRSKKPVGPPVKVDKLRRATIRRELWTMAYNSVLPNDPSGVAIFMTAIASSSHIELLDRQRAWKGDDLTQSISREDWVDGVRAINAGVQAIRSNFSHAIESIAMQSDPTVLASLWKIPGIAKAATILLLSPADNIHDPILSLISQSFEADERGDCFRELLKRYPDQAVDGLCEFLSNFINIARISPESCSLAKWLVRCFTDIIEALCQGSDTADPLLSSSSFLSTFAGGKSMPRRLQDLWQLMTTSLAVIFKRTQAWAPLFDNDVMIDWMRDAIIFGRQMTEHTRIFEAAVLGRSESAYSGGTGESPSRVTRTGKDLVSKLHVVLVELVSWLRLTE
jgi:senataxin